MTSMKKMKIIAPLGLLGLSLVLAYPVLAHCGKCAESGKKIAAGLDKHSFTLAKAVTAAETHSKGRSISAVSELTDTGEVAVKVYCVAAGKMVVCDIDSTTGSVKGMKDATEFPNAPKTHAHDHDDDHADPHQAPPGAAHPAPGGSAPAPGGSAMMIRNQTLEAGCGACIYKMSGAQGCPLALVVDGKPYLVQGAAWPNHDYCDRKVQAVVTGRLEGDKVIVTTLTPKS